MKWLEFVFKQYREDVEEFQKMLQSLQPQKTTPKQNTAYAFGNLYYVLIDTSEYPYEAVVFTPYWELATNDDIITEFDGRKWALLSIPRYPGRNIIKHSVELGEVDKEDVRLMYDHLHNGRRIPRNKRGLTPPPSGPQVRFREMERKRSLILNEIDLRGAEVPQVVEIDLAKSVTGDRLKKEELMRPAAASFDEFKRYAFGDIIATENAVRIVFNDDFKGTLARVYLSEDMVYEGVLPGELILQLEIKNLDTIAKNMKIEFL